MSRFSPEIVACGVFSRSKTVAVSIESFRPVASLTSSSYPATFLLEMLNVFIAPFLPATFSR